MTALAIPPIMTAGLFEYVQTWRGIFQKFDSDRSGTYAIAQLCSLATVLS
jgi:hypothetical protein